MVIKTCLVCKEEFDAKGHNITCGTDCRLIRKQETKRNWRINNPEKVKEQKKRSYQKNKKQHYLRSKKWRLNNPEKIRESDKKYRISHSLQIKQKDKKWAAANLDKHKENQRRYYKKYPERHKAAVNKWIKLNPDKAAEIKLKNSKKLLKQNPELTQLNKYLWSYCIRQTETKAIPNSNYIDNFESHHIIPQRALPHIALEEWNGIPLPKEWHSEFHSMVGGTRKSFDPLKNWSLSLFNFIEYKIKHS